jgi:anti-sigma regulatory factor (Ser/Thr protein kinase)
VSKTLHFGRGELARARELVAQEADEANLSSGRTTDLVIAVNEVVANSVRHGGGGGKLRVCREDDALVVEVRDCGRIDDPLVGRQPAPLARAGRGLWMVRQLCDLVQIRSGPEGTDIRLQMSLSSLA